MDSDLHEALYSGASLGVRGQPTAALVNSFRIRLKVFLESLPQDYQDMAVCDLASALEQRWTE